MEGDPGIQGRRNEERRYAYAHFWLVRVTSIGRDGAGWRTGPILTSQSLSDELEACE
jgi:hypothetical protein